MQGQESCVSQRVNEAEILDAARLEALEAEAEATQRAGSLAAAAAEQARAAAVEHERNRAAVAMAEREAEIAMLIKQMKVPILGLFKKK